MKTYLIPRTLLLVTAIATLGLTSCDAPVGYSNNSYRSYGYSPYGSGASVYNTLPFGYSGNAYYHNNRYYSGGRYQPGTFNYQGQSYNGRYQHGNGQYLYGGQHQNYPSKSASPGHSSHTSFSPVRNSGFLPRPGHLPRP